MRFPQSTTARIALALTATVALLVAGGLWYFFGGDSPDEVNLETATEQVADVAATSSDSDQTTATDVSGQWTVDAETGEFDYASATGSFVGFRIEEVLSSICSTTAVGRTGDVSGALTIDGSVLTAASFDVDMTTITTEESRRDDNVQDALETGDFPTATFTLTEPVELGAGAATGDAVSVTAAGDLTIHGVTQSVSIPIEAQLVGDTIVVVGSIDIVFADYDVAVPESQIVVSVEDEGVLELQLLFTR